MIALSALAVPGSGQTPPLRRYTADDGLPRSVVTAIAEGPMGYLWLGTPNGLARFDGRTFRRFDQDDGLPDQLVRSLQLDREGVLWVGTETGLSRAVGDGFEQRTPEGLRIPFRCLAEAEDGSLWAGTWGGGAVRFAGSEVQRFGPEEGLGGTTVRACLRDGEGRIWLGVWGGGVVRVEEGSPVRLHHFGTEDGLGDLQIRTLSEDPEGRLLVGTTRALYRQGEDGRFEVLLEEAAVGIGAINDILHDRRGDLWLATRNAGVCRRDGEGRLTCFGAERGLGEDSVNCLYEDREGSLWAGTFGGGATRLTPEGLLQLTVADGLPHPNAAAVAETPDGVIWLGTHGGGVVAWKDGITRSYGTAEGLPHEKVLSFGVDARGSLWVGTLGGAAVLHDDRFVPLTRADGLAGDVIFDIAVTGETIWFGTDGGLVALTDGRLRSYGPADGLPGRRITQVIPARDGGLWLGTAFGVSRFDGDRFANYSLRQEGDDYVASLFEDPDGVLWIGTFRGLFRLEGSRPRLADAPTVARLYCAALVADSAGRLWVGTPSGIHVLGTGFETVFKARGGLPSGEVNDGAALLAHDGRLWFGTVGGFVIFEPGISLLPPPPPPTHVARIVVGDQRVEPGDPIRLTRGSNDLHLEVVAVSLALPEELSLEVRMEGLQDRWLPSESRSIDYRALPSGRFTFQARARVRDGEWSETTPLSIAVASPWWQSWPARGAGLAVLLGLFVAGHRIRSRSILRRAHELELLVTERTRELSELDRQKNEFLGIAAHDLRTPLGSVRGFADLLLSLHAEGRHDEELERRFLGRIRTATETMHRLVNDLLDVAAIESGRVRLRVEPHPLASILLDHLPPQQATAHKKGIVLELQPPSPELVVLVDPDRIGEVLDNLVGNAVKYTLAGGRVRIWTEEEAEIARVHVEDTGVGLQPEELSQAFRGGTLSARPTGGESSTGFGLVIVRKLVELHGGTTSVASVPGEGSRFSFTLPRAPASASRPIRPSSDEATPSQA